MVWTTCILHCWCNTLLVWNEQIDHMQVLEKMLRWGRFDFQSPYHTLLFHPDTFFSQMPSLKDWTSFWERKRPADSSQYFFGAHFSAGSIHGTGAKLLSGQATPHWGGGYIHVCLGQRLNEIPCTALTGPFVGWWGCGKHNSQVLDAFTASEHGSTWHVRTWYETFT